MSLDGGEGSELQKSVHVSEEANYLSLHFEHSMGQDASPQMFEVK